MMFQAHLHPTSGRWPGNISNVKKRPGHFPGVFGLDLVAVRHEQTPNPRLQQVFVAEKARHCGVLRLLEQNAWPVKLKE